ncbi:MAG: hypothetical protein IE886_01090 [Campylobacterales bacterium]|nr:hypothetical protein [Campylobacterales bacterium]
MKTFLPFIVAAVLMQGCGSSSTADAFYQPSAALCDASKTLDDGTLLCAVRPSRLDPAARDRFGTATLQDQQLGFGYHSAVFPPEGSSVKGVYVHMVGTFGRPYNQESGLFSSETFMHEAAQNGFVVLNVAYHNRYLVNGTTECGGHPEVNNCAGRVREEKLTGVDLSAVVDVPTADAVIPRLQRLVAYFESNGFHFPVTVVGTDGVAWENLYAGGHSQGAGQALYLSKFFGVGHVCMLAGIYDVPDDVPAAGTVADWITDTPPFADPASIRAVTATDDPSYGDFVDTYGQLGLQEGVQWKSFYAATYHDAEGAAIGAHEAAVDDPVYALLRQRACFETGSFEGLQ